jgi:hypothetical protein
MISIRHGLETADGIERRARRRYPVGTDVLLTLVAGDREHTCLVEDVSLGGVRLRLEGPITLSQGLQVKHPDLGCFESDSRWISGDSTGLSFTNQDAAIRLCVHCLKTMVPVRELRDIQATKR